MAATMCLSDDEYDDMIGTGDDEAWEESDPADTNLPTKCLFCDCISDSVDAALAHCDSSHTFHMLKMCANSNMDCFMFIKLVNYIRKKHISPIECDALLRGPTRPPWDSDEFMIPADPEDPFLQYDLESAAEEYLRSVEEVSNGGGECPEKQITLPKSDYEALQGKLRDAETRATQAEEGLCRAMQDLQKLRNVAQSLVMNSENLSETPLQSLTVEEDEAYFSAYSHFSIHEEMLKDKVRTESYRDFLFQNPSLVKDKTVLDVGCGTGILSMFAARAGAKQVIAVDQSDVIYQAMDIVKENGLEDVITFVKGRLEDVELPVDKVDIIISEWMGYFLLFESMLDTVLLARDKHLTSDGLVFPDRCTMSIGGIDDGVMHQAHIAFWEDVYGFKMSCMKKEVVREASVEVVSLNKLITQPFLLKDINVCLAKTSDLDFTSDLSLTVTKDGNLTALVGYFDIFFESRCDHEVKFSTGPGSDYTHWKQTVFLLEKPIPVTQGQVITGTLSCRKDRKDPRNLIIGVKLQGESYTFFMQ